MCFTECILCEINKTMFISFCVSFAFSVLCNCKEDKYTYLFPFYLFISLTFPRTLCSVDLNLHKTFGRNTYNVFCFACEILD